MRWPLSRDAPGSQDDESLEAPSVDVVFAEMRRTLDAQQAQITMLDTNAAFILTSASSIVGFSGLSELDPNRALGGSGWLIPSLLVYLALVVSVIQAHRLRVISSSTSTEYGWIDPTATKCTLLSLLVRNACQRTL